MSLRAKRSVAKQSPAFRYPYLYCHSRAGGNLLFTKSGSPPARGWQLGENCHAPTKKSGLAMTNKKNAKNPQKMILLGVK